MRSSGVAFVVAVLLGGAAFADVPPRPPPEPETPERWLWAVAIGAAVLALELAVVWWRWGRRPPLERR